MANEKSVMAVIRAARPSFKNNNDKLAFAVHASFLASGYVLIATGPAALSPTAISSPSTDEVGIDGWNDVVDEYVFLYLSPENGGKKVLVKCLAMNDTLSVSALAEGAEEQNHTKIVAKEYVNETGGGNYAEQFKNLDKLVKKLEDEVLSKLGGSSSESPKPSSSTNNPRGSESRGGKLDDVDVVIDEAIGSTLHPSGVVVPPVSPFHFNDTVPCPGAGIYPVRGSFNNDGSMLLGPDDPRWFRGGGEQPGFPGRQPGIPPGARFDPYGPSGVPGFEPHRFGRNQPRSGGGIHPDLEHFGSGSDFI